ncbi:MAG TPA: hypothetical protein VMT52_02205 [Planctomycetota bacterium]|nr:hypothetical protein [Planctomycetota bacterium]
MAKSRSGGRSLEERIYELLMSYPERIDEMETRSEVSCRELARKIVELMEGRAPSAGDPRRPSP